MKTKYLIFIAFVVIALIITGTSLYFSGYFSADPTKASGFGISPPVFRNENLYPGDTVFQTVYLLRNENESDAYVSVATRTPDFSNWISFKPSIMVIPKGEYRAAVMLTATIPSNAKPGNYDGAVYFMTSPNKKQTGVGIGIGARMNIDLTVKAKPAKKP